jgi:hypothetical protein
MNPIVSVSKMIPYLYDPRNRHSGRSVLRKLQLTPPDDWICHYCAIPVTGAIVSKRGQIGSVLMENETAVIERIGNDKQVRLCCSSCSTLKGRNQYPPIVLNSAYATALMELGYNIGCVGDDIVRPKKKIRRGSTAPFYILSGPT